MTTAETITLPRAEYEALLDRLEEAEDALSVKQFSETVDAHGWEAAIKDCLPIDLVERKLAGEHPTRIWREQRKLTLRALAERAHLPASYISEIENFTKPGSYSAYVKIGRALGLPPDAVGPDVIFD
jgi:hypothetical protein